MKIRLSKTAILLLISTLIIFSALLFFKGNFYVDVYDNETKEFLEMNYNDISTTFSAQCVGTPGTGESGYYIFEPRIAFPGFVTVKVEGYETKTVFGFLGFNAKIKVYMKSIVSADKSALTMLILFKLLCEGGAEALYHYCKLGTGRSGIRRNDIAA